MDIDSRADEAPHSGKKRVVVGENETHDNMVVVPRFCLADCKKTQVIRRDAFKFFFGLCERVS